MALSKDLSSKDSVCKVTFELSAASVNGASTAALLGDFNGWNSLTHPMAKQKNGNFKTAIELEAGRAYEFRYLLDGQTWLNDDQGDNYVWTRVSNDENFVVVVPAQSVPAQSVPAQPVPAQSAAPKAEKTPVAKKVVAKTEKAPIAAKTVVKATKTVAAKADDLTIIEGIGPKAAKVLIAGGISTFAELAKAKATAVKEILTATIEKVGHLDPTTWAKQAKLAADGKFEALEVLKKELNNGKVVK